MRKREGYLFIIITRKPNMTTHATHPLKTERGIALLVHNVTIHVENFTGNKKLGRRRGKKYCIRIFFFKSFRDAFSRQLTMCETKFASLKGTPSSS